MTRHSRLGIGVRIGQEALENELSIFSQPTINFNYYYKGIDVIASGMDIEKVLTGFSYVTIRRKVCL